MSSRIVEYVISLKDGAAPQGIESARVATVTSIFALKCSNGCKINDMDQTEKTPPTPRTDR